MNNTFERLANQTQNLSDPRLQNAVLHMLAESPNRTIHARSFKSQWLSEEYWVLFTCVAKTTGQAKWNADYSKVWLTRTKPVYNQLNTVLTFKGGN